MRKRLALATAPVVAAVGFLGAAPAGAAISCTYTPGNHTVTVQMTAQGDNANVRVSAGAILVDGSPCGSATVENTNTVTAAGAAGAQTLTIDESGGAFVHSSGAGEREIKFSANLLTGRDSVVVVGSPGDDIVRLGTGGINLDGDSDKDVTFGSVENVGIVDVLGGTNTLTANGGFGTSAPWPAAMNITGGPDSDTIVGGTSDDSLLGGTGPDTIGGTAGNDHINGGDADDVITGGEDDDVITGEKGNDTIVGGPGNDAIASSAFSDGNDSFAGGEDEDSISYSIRGNAGVSVSLDGVANDGRPGAEFDNVMPDVEDVYGSEGPDVIVGWAPNVIDGFKDSDTISGGAGADLLSGGFDDAAADILNGGSGGDGLNGDDGPDQLNGDIGSDSLQGGPGNDVEKGGSGNDAFTQEGSDFSNGADIVQGDVGVDTVNYFGRTGDLTITLDNNANDGLAGEHDNVKPDVERIFSGFGNDTLTGSPADNTINGSAGNDTIKGGPGDDTLNGDQNNDTITGGDGIDTMNGGTGADSFHALDGGFDTVHGGFDADTDVVLDKDPFDSISGIP
jgi:Ca2+-binding RTX toxin-like protein